jgi:hypothetical protein
MNVTWLLNTFGLYITTVGALLLFLYLWRSPPLVDAWTTPAGKIAYPKHRRRLLIGVALLATWLVLENLAVIFL